MSEENKIKKISALLPRSSRQVNKLYESDSEIIHFGDSYLLFNIDDFSSEDYFIEENPFNLGWNMAVAAISDVLASGGSPLYYAHSMVLSSSWSEEYIAELTKGVAEALKQSGAYFIGGDLGIDSGDKWHYTATVIGTCNNSKYNLRSGAREGDIIYMSGEIGLGNYMAMLKLMNIKVDPTTGKPLEQKFPLRMKESELINKYATAAIDTSDGILNTLNILADVSRVGYKVNESSFSYLREQEILSKHFSMPPFLLFVGEAGEYELIFTIRAEDQENFLKESREHNLKFSKLGEITNIESTRTLERVISAGGGSVDLTTLNFRARDFLNPKDYLTALIKWYKGI
ncbi:MAG: thiamine-monophosphate kinase [Oligoflexia bacterium]|nr:thiamine-monophosphate kinase [Oligoflexia bacterium]